MKTFVTSVHTSLRQSRVYIVSIFIAYCLSSSAGIVMVHMDNTFALSKRDSIVGRVIREDQAAINYQSGNHLKAALYDFKGNLFYSVIQSFLGLSVAGPYFTVVYQGWVGGIVSVDGLHHSRLKKAKSASYYFIVLLLQFLAYSLSIGAGVKAGVDIYKQNLPVGWKIWKFKIRKENFTGILYIYVLSIPVFFIASLFEFYSTWNI